MDAMIRLTVVQLEAGILRCRIQVVAVRDGKKFWKPVAPTMQWYIESKVGYRKSG